MGYLGQAPAPQVATSVDDNAVDTAAIQDSAVTDAKIASGVTSSKLTGALPAIDGSALTGIASSQWTTTGSDIYYNTGDVGIGTSSPSSYNSAMNNLVAYGSGDSGITIASGTASEGSLAFADGTTGNEAYRGWINYNHGSDFMRMFTAGTERMRIDSSGNVGIGTTNPSGLGGASVNTVTNGSTSYQYVGAVNGTKTFIAYGDASQNIMGSVTNIPLIFRTNNAEQMRIDGSGNLKFNSGYGSATLAYGCRAWVDFSSNTNIRGNGNVSSITDNGVGDFTVNFVYSLVDSYYATTTALKPTSGASSTNGKVVNIKYNQDPTTSNVRLYCSSTGGTEDFDRICVAIFR